MLLIIISFNLALFVIGAMCAIVYGPAAVLGYTVFNLEVGQLGGGINMFHVEVALKHLMAR